MLPVLAIGYAASMITIAHHVYSANATAATSQSQFWPVLLSAAVRTVTRAQVGTISLFGRSKFPKRQSRSL